MFGGAVWETFTVWANKPGLGKRKIEMLFLFICYLKKHLPGKQINTSNKTTSIASVTEFMFTCNITIGRL